ncbi:HlyD family secretion protein [Aminipila luticellarii]|uniref:HlyD family efflux transporter periplasmic adaptor subunit n=1 Tax=Aminipila luticellarii TaxID=2507160 RepID=A0A410PX22_9FIRM|nr:HlyD family efflux transporter periplasmic adaptor subunit [Aminipila luticellarii]QAT43498.1 HlyD family efflux transporter periplasmic adaptor subunit [Aminipila luticellarii]
MIKSKKKIIPVIIVLLIGMGLFYVYGKDSREYTGQVEGILVSHCSEVSGKIVKCPVELGSPVKKGDTVAVVDDTNQRYVVEQLALNLQKAKLAVNNSKVGKGGIADNNYSAAKANYDSAVAVETKTKEDYHKAKALYEQSAISQDALNSAKVAYETAAGAVEDASARMKNVSDRTAGNSAEIDVAVLESQLNQQTEILKKYTITAGCDGIVMSKNYEEGDVIGAGYNIADISSSKERYAVIYFPVDQLDRIKYNQKAAVNLGETSIEGKIKYIDVKAQYTPKEMQSAANRNQESIRVKILLPAECKVSIGQRVKVAL